MPGRGSKRKYKVNIEYFFLLSWKNSDIISIPFFMQFALYWVKCSWFFCQIITRYIGAEDKTPFWKRGVTSWAFAPSCGRFLRTGEPDCALVLSRGLLTMCNKLKLHPCLPSSTHICVYKSLTLSRMRLNSLTLFKCLFVLKCFLCYNSQCVPLMCTGGEQPIPLWNEHDGTTDGEKPKILLYSLSLQFKVISLWWQNSGPRCY